MPDGRQGREAAPPGRGSLHRPAFPWPRASLPPLSRRLPPDGPRRSAWRAAMAPGLAGAGVCLALYLAVAVQQLGHYAHPAGLELRLVGVTAPDTVERLLRALRPVVLTTNLILFLFHLATGFMLGALSGRLADDLGRLGGRCLVPAARAVVGGLSVTVVAGVAFATVAARYPFQYDRWLHRRGGVLGALQHMLTAHADPAVLEAATWGAVAGLALVPLLRLLMGRPALAALLLGLGGAGLAGVHRPATAVEPNQGPNVVLILLESARPDYLSVNGYPRPTTPALERLVADGGVTFTDAWAHANGTVASVVTMLTSTYAAHHGIRSMFHGAEFARPGIPTLPAVLRAAGYATRVVADWDGDVTYFNAEVLPGFDQYDVAEFGVVNYVKQVYAQHPLFYALTDNWLGHRAFATFYRAGGGYAPAGGDQYYRDRIARHLAELAGRRRFFLTLFFADAHINYRCPHPYYATFTDPAYAGPSKYQAVANPHAPAGSPAEAAQIAGLYAGCLRAQDDDVAFVVETLRRWGLDERTIVVVTGDHGERLPDHVSFRYGRHGAWLDPAQFRVPLVIRAPHVGGGPRRVEATVRHVDLMPTILDLAGLPVPAGARGVSVAPLMRGGAPAAPVDVLGETGFHWTPAGPPYLGYASLADVVYLRVDPEGALLPRYFLRADCVARIDLAKHRFLRRAGFQLNYRPLVAGARTELYDLAGDPDLLRDLAGERPEVVADLKLRLLAWALEHAELVVRNGELSTRDPRDRERCAP